MNTIFLGSKWGYTIKFNLDKSGTRKIQLPQVVLQLSKVMNFA
jgi:hypothetical protein